MMRIDPIIPIWLLAIWSVIIIVLCLQKKNKAACIRRIIIVLLIFVLNLRVMIPSNQVEEERETKDIQVVFVVDGTISMEANDCENGTTRRQAYTKDCSAIMERMSGARFSVISFHNYTQVRCPFTQDYAFVNRVIESVTPLDTLWARGTNLTECKATLLKVVKNASENGNGDVVVVYISDGENNTDKSQESFADLKQYIDGGIVIGYGTKAGGTMQVYDEYEDAYKYVEDASSYPRKNAVSKINEDNLKKLATDMGLEYINHTDQTQIMNQIDKISEAAKTSTNTQKDKGYHETYMYCAIPLAGLFIYELRCYTLRTRKTQTKKKSKKGIKAEKHE